MVRPSVVLRLPAACALACALLLALAAGSPLLAQEGAASAAAPALLAPLSDQQQLDLPEVDPALPSPARFLGYPLGERFTRHADILRYLEALDAASPKVALWHYGETYEHRPLVLLAISSEANIARLDALRRDRLRLDQPAQLAGEARERLVRELPAVVWLAYGVHGNESSSAEAGMAAAYLLAAGRGERAPNLDRTVILLDPLVNPDGRERYVNGYISRRGSTPNPDPFSIEHEEPWPGGRGNHYYVDLNRDWAWASQQETRARLAEVNAWEPQVYVDFHEMGADSTYFFPPAAEPIHPAFGAGTRRWLDTFGRANAAAFDRLGWTYYVGEEYDLFYPGYGDSYPSLRGGVGMTYEVAGGGRAGSTIEREAAGPWSLADRVARHLATSLATVATATASASQLVADFASQRDAQTNGAARVFYWIDAPEAEALARLLERHGLAVGRVKSATQVHAKPVTGGEPRDVTIPGGSWMVSTGQPLGALAQALLEREATLPGGFLERQRQRVAANLSPEFYDVTAWSLPLAYNLTAWMSEDPPAASNPLSPAPVGLAARGQVGYLLPPAGLAGYRFAAQLLRAGIPFRVALDSLTVGERPLPAGTLFVPRAGRPGVEGELETLAREAGVHLLPTDSSLTRGGIPLGSTRMVPIKRPRIGLVGGPGVGGSSFGFLWHLLDQDVAAPHSVLSLDSLGDADLGRFDVLVLPEGSGYRRALGDDETARLKAWVQGGGVLVAQGAVIDWLHDKELTSVARHKDEAESDDEGGAPAAADADRVWDTERFVPGAAVATELRPHPLTVGVTDAPPALFWGDTFYDATGDPQQDLLRVRLHEPVLAGAAWPEGREALAGTLLVGAEYQGRGKVVVFTQDPAFRLFWRGTMPLLLDAVLYGPSMP